MSIFYMLLNFFRLTLKDSFYQDIDLLQNHGIVSMHDNNV